VNQIDMNTVPAQDRRLLSEPSLKVGLTNKTRGQLFAALRDYLQIDAKDKVTRIAFARAQGVNVYSYDSESMTEGQGQYLLKRVEAVGPPPVAVVVMDADVLEAILDAYAGSSSLVNERGLRDRIQRARFNAKIGLAPCA
jgi:hypothetical protein